MNFSRISKIRFEFSPKKDQLEKNNYFTNRKKIKTLDLEEFILLKQRTFPDSLCWKSNDPDHVKMES